MDLHKIRSEYDDSLYICLFNIHKVAASMSGVEATVAPFYVGYWIFFRAITGKGKRIGKVVDMLANKVYGGVELLTPLFLDFVTEGRWGVKFIRAASALVKVPGIQGIGGWVAFRTVLLGLVNRNIFCLRKKMNLDSLVMQPKAQSLYLLRYPNCFPSKHTYCWDLFYSKIIIAVRILYLFFGLNVTLGESWGLRK